MREYTKAMDACGAATEADVDKKNQREIEGQMRKCMEEMNKERAGETEQQTLQRAMKDPEVAVSRQDSAFSSMSARPSADQSASSFVQPVNHAGPGDAKHSRTGSERSSSSPR